MQTLFQLELKKKTEELTLNEILDEREHVRLALDYGLFAVISTEDIKGFPLD